MAISCDAIIYNLKKGTYVQIHVRKKVLTVRNKSKSPALVARCILEGISESRELISCNSISVGAIDGSEFFTVSESEV